MLLRVYIDMYRIALGVLHGKIMVRYCSHTGGWMGDSNW